MPQRYGRFRTSNTCGYLREGPLSLATVHLQAGELDAARATVQAARSDDYPSTAADLALILGIALARQATRDAASQAFTDAVRSANALIEQTCDNYHGLDTKALALCGLGLVDGPDQLTEASTVFRAARAITHDKGTVQRVMRLMGPPSECSRFVECRERSRDQPSTTRGPMRIFGAGFRMIGRAWTTWTGCAGPTASGALCVTVSRGGGCPTADGRAVVVGVVSRRPPARSFTAHGLR